MFVLIVKVWFTVGRCAPGTRTLFVGTTPTPPTRRSLAWCTHTLPQHSSRLLSENKTYVRCMACTLCLPHHHAVRSLQGKLNDHKLCMTAMVCLQVERCAPYTCTLVVDTLATPPTWRSAASPTHKHTQCPSRLLSDNKSSLRCRVPNT